MYAYFNMPNVHATYRERASLLVIKSTTKAVPHTVPAQHPSDAFPQPPAGFSLVPFFHETLPRRAYAQGPIWGRTPGGAVVLAQVPFITPVVSLLG